MSTSEVNPPRKGDEILIRDERTGAHYIESGASLLCPSDGRGKGEREREEKREGG